MARKFKIILFLLSFLSTFGWAEPCYTVDGAVDDVDLFINGLSFSAKSYCADFQVGDSVLFLTGDPDGNCTDAIISNSRTNQTCDVWCQYPV